MIAVPVRTLVTAAHAAKLLNTREGRVTNYRLHKDKNGPPYVYCDGQVLYDLTALLQWNVERDVAQFIALARRMGPTFPELAEQQAPFPIQTLDDFLNDVIRPVERQPPPAPAPRPVVKRGRRGPYKKRRAVVATAPPPPPKPAAAQPDVVSVKGMGPSEAIPVVLNTTHPEPMKYGDLLSYLKVAGYQGSLQGIGVAVQALKAKGILKRTDEGWVLIKE